MDSYSPTASNLPLTFASCFRKAIMAGKHRLPFFGALFPFPDLQAADKHDMAATDNNRQRLSIDRRSTIITTVAGTQIDPGSWASLRPLLTLEPIKRWLTASMANARAETARPAGRAEGQGISCAGSCSG
jgi:hypothetical protein